ncbi:MAG: tol-pal system protein YbgF [Kofleriaceae bacterium]
MSRQALCVLLLVGCASPVKALREDNRRLDKEVTGLRDERRAQDRKMRDLQHQLDKLRADKVSSLVAQMPSLPVEVVGPSGAAKDARETNDGSRVIGVTDDGTEIVYEGDAAMGKVATWDDEPVRPRVRRVEPEIVDVNATRGSVASVPASSSSERIEVTRRIPPVSARVGRTAMRDRDSAPLERSDAANADYRAAVELVRSGDHATAVASLRAFLQKFPRHDYADNAQYWLGEAFYAQKDYPRALGEFRNVIETYPRGNKVPDALLKVGFCYQAMGQGEKARAVLEQVVNLYPKTEPAALASKRLEGGT